MTFSNKHKLRHVAQSKTWVSRPMTRSVMMRVTKMRTLKRTVSMIMRAKMTS